MDFIILFRINGKMEFVLSNEWMNADIEDSRRHSNITNNTLFIKYGSV